MVTHYLLEDKIDIPDGVNVSIQGNMVTVSGKNGSVNREFIHPRISIIIAGKTIIIRAEKVKKKTQALYGTWRSHLRNMITGLTEGFEYKMKAVYSHFPMKISVKGDHVEIDNFLGEAVPRRAKILGDTVVKISGQELSVTGIDKEHVGQTAANIEQKTKIKRFDPRVFQDGIYIISKGR